MRTLHMLLLTLTIAAIAVAEPPSAMTPMGAASGETTNASQNPAQGNVAAAKPDANGHFYVYKDKSSPLNHYIPSGWMGDYGDIKIDDSSKESPKDGATCFKVTYNAKASQGANWAGIFWQQPANNWGNKPGGFNLTGFKKLTFWARGAKGTEKVAELKVGGITGENPDTDSASIGPVTLTKEWKQYTIDLNGKSLEHIIGAFAWSASKDDNPEGFTFYLDNVRFES